MERSEELDNLAVLGLAASGLLHDLANHLNRIALQSAILQRRAAEVGPDIAVIRDECRAAAALIRAFQTRREGNAKKAQPNDLPTMLDLPRADVPPVAADPETLRLLVGLVRRGLPRAVSRVESVDGGCRWVSEFVSDGEVSTDDVLADNGPFRELGAMERQAIARGLRETGGECGIHGEGPRFRVEITWKPSE